MKRLLMLLVAATSVHASTAGAAEMLEWSRPSAGGVVMIVGGQRDVPASGHSRAATEAGASTDRAVSASRSVVFQIGPTNVPRRPANGDVTRRVLALGPVVERVAEGIGVDDALLMAVIDVESGGRPDAVSPKGAVGLMQLMPKTGAHHGARDLLDPVENVMAGARYLNGLLRRYGDVELALAAYNAGEGAVDRYGGRIPPFEETINYVPRVMTRYAFYQSRANLAERSAGSFASGRIERVGL